MFLLCSIYFALFLFTTRCFDLQFQSPLFQKHPEKLFPFLAIEQVTNVNSAWLQVAEQAWYSMPNMFDTTVQRNKTSPIKHYNKRNILSCLIECLMAYKINFIKHDQTAPNEVAKQYNVWWCLVAKHYPFGLSFWALSIQFSSSKTLNHPKFHSRRQRVN